MSTEQAGAVVIQVTAADFERLCENSMLWAGGGWDAQPGRFGSDDGSPSSGRQWQWIHWLGESYPAVIFARAFLAARGFEYEVLYDTAEHPDGRTFGWVLLTDYDAPR